MSLIEIEPDPALWRFDLRYASANNMVGRALTRSARLLLHQEAAARLRRAADSARRLGLVLVIFDGYRPRAVQEALWAICPDPDYVADPRQGSAHTRGVAVDLGLGDAEGLLDFGTGFDDMTPQSHHGAGTVPLEAQRHRLLLLGLMAQAGFRHSATEWWHYQLDHAETYPLLDHPL